MGKKYDDALTRIREIRNAIPEAAEGIMPDGPHDVKAKVTMDGLAAGIVADALIEAIDGDMADKDADVVAGAIVRSVAVASSLGTLMLV